MKKKLLIGTIVAIGIAVAVYMGRNSGLDMLSMDGSEKEN
jgi:hypothetical protein